MLRAVVIKGGDVWWNSRFLFWYEEMEIPQLRPQWLSHCNSTLGPASLAAVLLDSGLYLIEQVL